LRIALKDQLAAHIEDRIDEILWASTLLHNNRGLALTVTNPCSTNQHNEFGESMKGNNCMQFLL
jgi:hypothetical protein